MRKTARKPTITRETVLSELALMEEGRHPAFETITARFIRDPEYQQAAKILSDAIQVESHQRLARRDEIPVPPGWLLPV